jgi:hypothetical protein
LKKAAQLLMKMLNNLRVRNDDLKWGCEMEWTWCFEGESWMGVSKPSVSKT